MNKFLFPAIAVLCCYFLELQTSVGQSVITTGSLIKDMTDMDRLTKLPTAHYRSVQYSSYDRRSIAPDKPFWYANSDGFGKEKIPGFMSTLKEPDSTGIGEYLICDEKGPGAIVRLWTASMTGTIKFILDGKEIFNGPSEKFFWAFPDQFGDALDVDYSKTFRQYDALYFPIPFAKSCRLEWRGNLQERHFYHVGMRLYEKGTKIQTFRPVDIKTYASAIREAITALSGSSGNKLPGNAHQDTVLEISASRRLNMFEIKGEKAIEFLQTKVVAGSLERTLRQLILRVYFDDSPLPQIEAPLGDFFGAAPGVNPYESLPLTVEKDSTMTCRFIMPFKQSARIQVENLSDQPVLITTSVATKPYNWDAQRSMYFRARWRINYGLQTYGTAGKDSWDVPYLLAMGEGRLVGAVCYLMNPSNLPTGNGSWWGEGDEKIFVDDIKTPAFFGTGSEDYYNYSWSSDKIFFFPYCGQPRNDGPANRGFVTNFRWHILDDILFRDKLAFYMELYTHASVSDFTYGRMIYLYGREGMLDDHHTISKDDVRPVSLPVWHPEALRGSLPYRYLNAEAAYKGKAAVYIEKSPIWAGGEILMWEPVKKGDKINFEVTTSPGKKNMLICLGHLPGSGEVRLYINGKPVLLKGNETLQLNSENRILNRCYSTESVVFREGVNKITLESLADNKVRIGIDLFCIKD